MADALASGASDRKVVWVQVPSPAPILHNPNTFVNEKVFGFVVYLE